MAAIANSQPGRTRPVRPHELNPYGGLWPDDREEPDIGDVFAVEE